MKSLCLNLAEEMTESNVPLSSSFFEKTFYFYYYYYYWYLCTADGALLFQDVKIFLKFGIF